MNAAQTVAAIYKGAERLRTTARSATRIDGDLKCIIEDGLRQILEEEKGLVFSLAFVEKKSASERQRSHPQECNKQILLEGIGTKPKIF